MDISLIYPNYSKLKVLTRWAGFIGIFQSLIWLGLSIVAIVHYHYCVTNYKDEKITFGTITEIVFYKLYFHGEVDNLPNIDFNILNKDDVKITLNSEQIYIWIWVYLVTSALWFFSSVSLILQIRRTQLRRANVLLYLWIFITLSTCGMDLALSIIFGLDYDKFNRKTYDLKLKLEEPKEVFNGIILLAAKDSSITMMIMAARGFILWFINVGFMVYFWKETFVISEATMGDRSLVNRDFMSDTNSIRTRPPINAYDTKNNLVRSNGENRNHSIQLNTAAIERANRISNSVLEDRHMGGKYNRGFSSFEQYPKPNNEYDPRYPEPDYTPPMPRANPFAIPPLRSAGSESLKNKRYL